MTGRRSGADRRVGGRRVGLPHAGVGAGFRWTAAGRPVVAETRRGAVGRADVSQAGSVTAAVHGKGCPRVCGVVGPVTEGGRALSEVLEIRVGSLCCVFSCSAVVVFFLREL